MDGDMEDAPKKNILSAIKHSNLNYFASVGRRIDFKNMIKVIDVLNELQPNEVNETNGWKKHFENFGYLYLYSADIKDLHECFEFVLYKQLQNRSQNWYIGDFIVELSKITQITNMPFSYISEKFVRAQYDEYNESLVNDVLKGFDQISSDCQVLISGLLRKTKDKSNRMKWMKHLMKNKNLIKNTVFTTKECVSPLLKGFLTNPYNLWACPPFLEVVLDLMNSSIAKEDIDAATLYIQQEICENPLPILISLISIRVPKRNPTYQSLIRDTLWSLLQNSANYVECFREILTNKPLDFVQYVNIKSTILEVVDEEYKDLVGRQDDKEDTYRRLIDFLTATNVVNDFLKITTDYSLMFKILSDTSINKWFNTQGLIEYRAKANSETFIPALLDYVKTKLVNELCDSRKLWLSLCAHPTQQNLDILNKMFTCELNTDSVDLAVEILSTLMDGGVKMPSSSLIQATTELFDIITCYSDWKKDKIVLQTANMEQMTNECDDNLVEEPLDPLMCDEYYGFLESNIFNCECSEFNAAIAETVKKLSKLLARDSTREKEFVNGLVARCMDRKFVDKLMYDQLYVVAKLLLAFEREQWITLEALMEFCYELFSHQVQISFAIVDVVLYELKDRVHEQRTLCSKFTKCIYFAELTPLLSVHIEFAAAGEITHLDVTAQDPVPSLYDNPECIKIIAEKALVYGPSVHQKNQFCSVEIGRVIVHVNDCNMKNQLVIAERSRIEELPNDLKSDVRFILNSSTMANIQQKSQELANRVPVQHYAALSHFLVCAIFSSSINVDVVSNIWLRLDLPHFYTSFVSDFCHMVKKSFFLFCDKPENIQIYLQLGNIFGEITLNRNVPIVDSNIDLKYLLIEAYFKRTTLHAALIFVCRTLVRSKQSHFFLTFNHYILPLLSLLKEIHVRLSSDGQTQMPIEIEQTFTELDCDINSVRASTYLGHPAYIMILPLVFQWSDMEALQLLNNYVHLTGFNHVVTPSVYQCIKYRDIEHIDMSRMLAFFNISFNGAAPRALSAKVAIHFAIERTYNEYARSVSERVSRGCLSLCETIILKDFPQDKYDDTMRRSVIDMARSVATSYSYTTLHGNLYPNLYKSFRQNIQEILASTSHQNSNSTTSYDVAEYANCLAADNVDLLINLIQKFCGEKLLTELVKKTSLVLESRLNCAPVEKSMRLATYGDTQKRLPPKLKVDFSSLSPEHKMCYTKFVNFQPGFMPDISTMDHLLECIVDISHEKKEQLEIICHNLEQLIETLKTSSNPSTDEHLVVELSTLKEMIRYLVESRLGRVIVAIIKHLIMTNFYLFGICLNSQVAFPLRVIVYFREILDVFRYWEGIGPYRLAKFVTRVVMEVPQTLQFSNETVFHLVRNHLIIVPDYDIFLAKCIDNAKNGHALKFSMIFCKTFLINEKQHNITNDHLKLTLSTLQYLTTVKNDPSTLNLDEHLKSPFTFPTKIMDPSLVLPGIDLKSFSSQLDSCKTVTERDACFENLFIAWLTHYYDDPIKLLDPNYISGVRKSFELAGFKPNTEYWKEFTKCTLRYGFKECLKEDVGNKFVCRICDSMAGFCSILVKSLYEFSNIGNVAAITHLFDEIGSCLMYIIDCCSDVTKISVVRRFLSNFCMELRRPFLNDEGDPTNERRKHFQGSALQPINANNINSDQLPTTTTSPAINDPPFSKQPVETTPTPGDVVADKADSVLNNPRSCSMHGLLQLMFSFAGLLHSIRPTRFPKFAAHWQKVVISSNVIPTLITGGIDKSGWIICNNIIVDALLFLGAIIRQGVLAPHRVRYFEEALALFQSLKEDFPQVISRYALMYVELLPINAIQMRNAFLCASPIATDSMPNPFMHRITNITSYELKSPEVVYDAMVCFEPEAFREQIFAYFTSGSDDKVLDRIFDLLTKSSQSNGKDFALNTVALNSVIFLCGHFGSRCIISTSVTSLNDKHSIAIANIKKGVPFYVIMYLLASFDSKGQYSVISAMANHLRFPNAHTCFFKCVFIVIAMSLCEGKDDDFDNSVVQLIIRTLTERLLPKPPHPWGIISTLSELLVDPKINLISKSCVTENKDIFALLNGIREKALE